MAELLFWMAVACCIVAQIAIVRATLRVPLRSEETALPHAKRLTEVAWTVIPAIVLALVLIATWHAIHAQGAGAAAAPLRFHPERTL